MYNKMLCFSLVPDACKEYGLGVLGHTLADEHEGRSPSGSDRCVQQLQLKYCEGQQLS